MVRGSRSHYSELGDRLAVQSRAQRSGPHLWISNGRSTAAAVGDGNWDNLDVWLSLTDIPLECFLPVISIADKTVLCRGFGGRHPLLLLGSYK